MSSNLINQQKFVNNIKSNTVSSGFNLAASMNKNLDWENEELTTFNKNPNSMPNNGHNNAKMNNENNINSVNNISSVEAALLQRNQNVNVSVGFGNMIFL
jgi:hypothetical protein